MSSNQISMQMNGIYPDKYKYLLLLSNVHVQRRLLTLTLLITRVCCSPIREDEFRLQYPLLSLTSGESVTVCCALEGSTKIFWYFQQEGSIGPPDPVLPGDHHHYDKRFPRNAPATGKVTVETEGSCCCLGLTNLTSVYSGNYICQKRINRILLTSTTYAIKVRDLDELEIYKKAEDGHMGFNASNSSNNPKSSNLRITEHKCALDGKPTLQASTSKPLPKEVSTSSTIGIKRKTTYGASERFITRFQSSTEPLHARSTIIMNSLRGKYSSNLVSALCNLGAILLLLQIIILFFATILTIENYLSAKMNEKIIWTMRTYAKSASIIITTCLDILLIIVIIGIDNYNKIIEWPYVTLLAAVSTAFMLAAIIYKLSLCRSRSHEEMQPREQETNLPPRSKLKRNIDRAINSSYGTLIFRNQSIPIQVPKMETSVLGLLQNGNTQDLLLQASDEQEGEQQRS